MGCRELDLLRNEGIDMWCEGNQEARPLVRVRGNKINFPPGHSVAAVSDDGRCRVAPSAVTIMIGASLLDYEEPSVLTEEFPVLENLRLVAVAADEARRVAGIVYEAKRRDARVRNSNCPDDDCVSCLADDDGYQAAWDAAEMAQDSFVETARILAGYDVG